MKLLKRWFLPVLFALAASSLTLNAAPEITVQPEASQRVTAGLYADFFVVADGVGDLTYRWRKNSVPLSDSPDGRITGTTGDYLLIFDLVGGGVLGDSGNYAVVVTDDSGSTSSSNALLTVLVPPQITTQPQSKTVTAGNNATFSVRAIIGTLPLSYQWYHDLSEIPRATNADFTITNAGPLDAGEYYVQVNNETGEPDISNIVTLTVNVPPIILDQPLDQTVVEGDEFVDFSVDIDPDSTEPLEYYWHRNDSYILFETNSIYTIDYPVTASDAGTYFVRIINVADTVYSSNALLTVLVPPKIKSQPKSAAKWWTNTTVTFSVAVDSTSTRPLSYQWFYEADPGGPDWPLPIPGATATNLTFLVTNMNQYGAYSCEISNTSHADLADYTTNTDDAILTVIQELKKPTVTTVSPTQDVIWTEPMMTYRGTASDNAGVRIVQYHLGTTSFPDRSVTNFASTTNGWINWVATFPAAIGSNRFEAWAFDTSGNSDFDFTKRFTRVVSDRVSVVVNPPGGGTVSGMTNGQWLAINSNYTATASAAQGCVFTNWVWTTNWAAWITSTVPVLSFTMQSNSTLQANFVDFTKPTNTINLPTPGQVLVNLTAQLRGEARDNAAVAAVRYQLNGSVWSSASSTNGWSNWVASVTLQAGSNTVSSYATDTSGHSSVTNTVTFAAMDKFLLGISNDLRLSLDASPAFSYRVDAYNSTNLQSTNWIPVINIPTQTAMPFYFRDPAATDKYRFYRALVQ